MYKVIWVGDVVNGFFVNYLRDRVINWNKMICYRDNVLDFIIKIDLNF